MNKTERVTPHHLEAEQAVLGAIVMSGGRALDELADTLVPQDFFREAHRQIYQVMLVMHSNNQPIDYLTLTSALARAELLEDAGGVAYVARLTDGVPRTVNTSYYARMIREAHDCRKVIDVATRLLDEAYSQTATPAELIDAAELGLLELSRKTQPGELLTAEALARAIYPELETLWEQRRTLTGLSTGFRDLDYYTHGLQPGTLYILAGRPSTGKSSLALQMALHVSQTQPVAFFSVEMSAREQMFRVLSTLAKVDGHQLQGGSLSTIDQQEVGRALAEFPNRRFLLDDASTLSPIQLRSRARRQKAQGGLALIVVDYLNLMKHEKAETREQQIAGTTRMLKQIARELDLPMLVLCQLNRKVDERADKRPTLSDLRESGSIEQDADVVFLIWRPPPKNDGATIATPPAELIIAKHRNGPATSVNLKFQGEHFRFVQVEA